MRCRFAVTVVVVACAVTASHARAVESVESERVPVLVELFTAEGCSSCPPADLLLQRMIDAQPAAGVEIVGLGEHVDYWDALGWRDRFSSAALTARQRQYADRRGDPDIYTPQIVVDGQSAVVGSDVAAVRRAIEEAQAKPHGALTVTCEASGKSARASVTVDRLPPASERAEVVVALTEGNLRTDVKRGENQGRTLTHAAVVRKMTTVADATVGASASANFSIDSAWQREHLRIVAFVQEKASRRVIATASVPACARE